MYSLKCIMCVFLVFTHQLSDEADMMKTKFCCPIPVSQEDKICS